MKILRCFVENFGIISKEGFEFEQGLSCIYKENGSGKTTLFVFIKAMLWGLEATTRRSLDENERNKYRPWNGARFGGWLEFSSESLGASFRVTRFFGEKESLDTFEVIDLATGLDAVDAFEGENIGFSLFGIDAEGFERTLFLSERNIEIKNSGSLTQKISSLASGDDYSYENAVKILDNKRKYYKNNQNRGYLIDLEESLRQRNAELGELLIKSENIKKLEEELRAQKDQLDDLSSQKEALETRSERISRALSFKKQQKSVEALSARLDELLKNRELIRQRYKNGSVSEEDAQSVQNKIDKLRKLSAQTDTDQCGELENQIKRLEEKLGSLEITKEDIPELLKKYSDAQSVDLLTLRQQSEGAKAQYESCKNSLPKEPLDENEIKKAQDIKAQIAALEAQKSTLADKYLEISRQKEINSDRKAVLILGFALVSVVFAALAITISPWLWAVFALSLVICAVSGVSFAKDRSKAKEKEREKNLLDTDIQNIKEKTEDLEEQYQTLLQKYAPYTDGNIASVKELSDKCADLERKYSELLQKYLSEDAKVKSIMTELAQILAPYTNDIETDGIGKILISISGELERLEYLRSRLEIAKDQQISLEKDTQNAKDELFEYIDSLLCQRVDTRDIPTAQRVYNTMMLDLSTYPKLEREIRELQRSIDDANASAETDSVDALDTQKDEAALTSELDAVKTWVLDIEQKREALRTLIGKGENTLEALYERCEDIPIIEQEIEEISEKARAAQEEFTTVIKTMEYLEKAKNSLASRYLGAIKENFADVFCKITNSESDAVKLDAKLALKFEIDGTLRDMQYFSRGTRDIMDFALRIALIKTLFSKQECPFILLDDPFASLDEKHLDIAKKCVRDVAGEYQVIYTVCNKDREI